MKMYYITLNTEEEAKNISHSLLTQQLAVCTNWFPIACAYRWEDKIQEGAEVVLIVKTQDSLRKDIEAVISQHISYTNFVAELDVHSINQGFMTWLNKDIPCKQ